MLIIHITILAAVGFVFLKYFFLLKTFCKYYPTIESFYDASCRMEMKKPFHSEPNGMSDVACLPLMFEVCVFSLRGEWNGFFRERKKMNATTYMQSKVQPVLGKVGSESFFSGC